MTIIPLPELVDQAPWWRPVFGGVLGLAGAGALGALAVPALSRLLLPKPEEPSLADVLPFDCLLDDERTLLCKDGSLTRTIRIESVDSAALSPDERRGLWRARREFVEALGDHDVTAKLFIQKQRRSPVAGKGPRHPFLCCLFERYLAQLGTAYQIRHTIAFNTGARNGRGAPRLEAAIQESLRHLQPFGCRELADAELLSFWAELADPVRSRELAARREDISDALASASITFDPIEGVIGFESSGRNKYALIAGVKLFGDATSEAIVPKLLSIDAELTLLFQIRAYSPTQALIALERRERMMLSSRYNASIKEQFDTARELVTQGAQDRQCLVECELSSIIFGDGPSEAKKRAEIVCEMFRQFRMKPIIETAIAQPQWFSQFPSQPFTALTRAATLMSKNVADLLSFERESDGFDHSDWGSGHILPFRNLSGGQYRFQFHRSEAKEESGHTIVIGANGSGKTLLMELLTLGALRHEHVRCFWFDRNFGVYPFTCAAGGHYVSSATQPSQKAGRLNPLQLPLTFDGQGNVAGRNADHLRNWFRCLLNLDDPQTDEQIGRALYLLKDLPPEHRELKALEDAFDHGTEARIRLKRWTDPMQYGGAFGGIPEEVGFESRLTSFDMTTLLDDPILGPPTIEHILFRIEAACEAASDGSLIVLDEAAQLCTHLGFRKRIVQYLQQIRKKRGVVVLMFQRSSSLDEIDANFANLMRSETTNQIFFPVAGAKPQDFAAWDLTDRELAFVTGRLGMTRQMRRPFLLRRPKAQPACSQILEGDVSGLGAWLGLLRSGAETVSEVMRLQRQWPEDWIGQFLKSRESGGGHDRDQGGFTRTGHIDSGTLPHSGS